MVNGRQPESLPKLSGGRGFVGEEAGCLEEGGRQRRAGQVPGRDIARVMHAPHFAVVRIVIGARKDLRAPLGHHVGEHDGAGNVAAGALA